MNTKETRLPWAYEPWPETKKELGRLQKQIKKEPDSDLPFYYIVHQLTCHAARQEQILRHALKLVNSLRTDAMHNKLDCELTEQRLSAIEEVLQ